MQIKQIKDFPGYFISSDGEVFSNMNSNKNRRGNLYKLKLHMNTCGYLVVALNRDKKIHTKAVHRLVAEHFIPNPEDKPQINHKDGIKINPRANNLEWVTRSENIKHAYKIGLLSRVGEDNTNAKLNWDKARLIRELYVTGLFTKTLLGRMFGIHRTQISDVLRNKYWVEK